MLLVFFFSHLFVHSTSMDGIGKESENSIDTKVRKTTSLNVPGKVEHREEEKQTTQTTPSRLLNYDLKPKPWHLYG